MNIEQANEVRRQIGLMTFMAVGGREAQLIDGKLKFRITISSNVKHWVTVELTGMDDYNVELLKQKRDRSIVVEMRAEGVYCDQISEVVYRLGSPKGQDEKWFRDVGIHRVDN